MTLSAVVRKLGRRPTPEEKLQVAQRRERLQGRIDAYQRKAAEFWAPDSTDSLSCPDCPEEVDFDSSDSEDEADNNANVFLTSPFDEQNPPESVPLLLPSNLGLAVCQEEGYSKYVQQERTLRVGQANDALQGLRLALSRKAVIFREQIRPARTKTRKLRSWDQIRMVDVNGRHHATVYMRARAAMIRLGATEEDLARYQVLKKEHLTVTTARIDPSLRGQRNQSLAWFWTMDVKKDTDQGPGMAECKVFEWDPLFCLMLINMQFIESTG